MDDLSQRLESNSTYAAARLKYALLRTVLRRAAWWKPQKEPRAGYTIIVGVPWQLWDLTSIPLLSLQRARRQRCAEIILAVDATERTMLQRHGHLKIATMMKNFASLRPRLVYYTKRQEYLARKVDWNWVDCWLTWVNAIAETSTRHALLHDFDAVVLDPDFCEKHYDIALNKNSTFTGIQRDIRHSDAQTADLLMTVELLLDVAAIRSLFNPVDLFNCIRTHQGKRIQCDILRDAQLRLPDSSRTLHEIRQDQLVHPSQVISQWHSLRQSRPSFAPQGYTPLFVIPYFRHVEGESIEMQMISEMLERGERKVRIDGFALDVSHLDQPGLDWIADQIDRLDKYFSDAPTPEVSRYTRAIRSAMRSVTAPTPDEPEITVRPLAGARSRQP